MRIAAAALLVWIFVCWCSAIAQSTAHLELITDRSAATDACGPAAVRWGFMCPIVARFQDRVYALNFTRTPDVAWDVTTPIEAPVAFWSRDNGKWTSVLLDSPRPTYQTPTLLLSPDGRAHVFTLEPADSAIQWFHAEDPSNAKFIRTEIPIGWGSYMSGAIEKHGLAALVYWGNSRDYPAATLGCTLLDTTTGKSRNITVDSPGAPYCYNQVFFDETGLHILGIRSEVADSLIAGSRNHYTDLRYYHCPDPGVTEPKWQRVLILHNDRACIQPLGNLVDPSGRVHLLYWYVLDDGKGNRTGAQRLVYAASREPVSAAAAPVFDAHEIGAPGDGRLFLTSDGAVHILAYATGTQLQHAKVIDPVAGKFTAWTPVDAGMTFSRIFPVDPRNGSTTSAELAAVLIGAVHVPEKNSLFYFTWQPGH
jgi:hypothetical protein